MANICCDDVIFYTEGNPEGLYDLWEDLETYIILNQNPDLCWIGNLFSHKKIDSTGISLRGNVSYMEWNDTYILLSLETAWTPLYEAYQAIAAAYHVPFVMQSIEPGERIYYKSDKGYQAYFVLETPVYVTSKSEFKSVKAAKIISQNIREYFGKSLPVDLTCNHFGIARIPRTDNVEFFDPNYRYSFKEWQDWSFKQTDNKGFTRSSLTVLSGTEGKKQVDEACA